MLNQGADGVMVFEPSVLKISVGDTVTFKPTNPGHNSASIAGMIPTNASSWDGGMSREVKITFTEEGTYVVEIQLDDGCITTSFEFEIEVTE